MADDIHVLTALEWEMAGQNLCRKLGLTYQELKAKAEAKPRNLTTAELKAWVAIGYTLEGDASDTARDQDTH